MHTMNLPVAIVAVLLIAVAVVVAGWVYDSRKYRRTIVVLVVVAIVVLAATVVVLVNNLQENACRVPFGTNLAGLSKALRVYANEDPEVRLPAGDEWCDVLVGYDFCTPKQFVHRDSDSIKGESDVAMNVNAAGRSFMELPPDMVLLFETDFGKERGRRKGFIKDRAWYQTFPHSDPKTRVYSKQWNQVGGPEILTTSHNRGDGCNVAFVDTSVKFVKTADLPKLKWKPDPNEK
jgi:hypothetical protein